MIPERTCLGMRDDATHTAVHDGQAFLRRQGPQFDPGPIDGIHGPKTEKAWCLWERAQSAPIPRPSYQTIPGADSKWVTEVITDPSYTHVPRDPGSVLWLTLHTGETGLSDASARGMAYDLKRRNNASAHYVVGPSVVIQQVPERMVAYTQGVANSLCISIEHAGRSIATATEPATDWAAQTAMLHASVRLARDICDRWGIPWRFVEAEGIIRREKGLTTHGEITKAYKVKGGHADPLHWPWDLYLSMGVA